MEVVEGTIGQIGRRSWLAKGHGGNSTTVSGLEIGHRRLKRVVLADYLSKVLEPGKFARLLILRGVTQGVVTRPVIAAVEVDGKTYKTDKVLWTGLLKIVLWMLVVAVIGAIAPVLGVVSAACIIGFYAKNYLDYRRF